MPTIHYNTHGGFQRLVIKETAKMQKFPRMKTNIITDILDVIATEADKRAHVITGRTKGSISSRVTGPNGGEVSAEFGAVWEERRSSPHDFMTQGATKGKKEAGRIAQLHLNALVINDEVKPSHQLKYTHITVSKSGRKIYHYRDPSLASGGTARRTQRTRIRRGG